MVQRAKSRVRALLSLIAAFLFSNFYKAPESQAQQTTGNSTAKTSTSSSVPSFAYSAALTQPINNGPSVSMKARYEPSAGTASVPGSITWQVPASRESDFQNWLKLRGVTDLTAEEMKDAATIYRMEMILDRLDQVEKDLGTK